MEIIAIKIEVQVRYIKCAQLNHHKFEEHNIKILSVDEIHELEQSIKYWGIMNRGTHKIIEYEWISCYKIWDFVEDLVTKCNFPSFVPLENFFNAKEVAKIMNIFKVNTSLNCKMFYV